MALSVEDVHREVVESLTAPGGPFELEPVTAGARAVRAYRHAPANLEEFFSAAAAAFGDRVLLVQEGQKHTFGEAFAAARRLAGGLQDEYGLRPGDRVGVAMRNRLEYFVALFAAARIGAVAVLLNSRGTAAELCAAVADVPCSVVVADGPRAARLAEGGCPAPLVVVPDVGEDGQDAGEDGPPPGSGDFAAMAAEGRREADAVRVDPDAPAWVLFTSGTSGRAKGAVLTQRNVGNFAKNLEFIGASSLMLAARMHGVPVETILAYSPPPSFFLIYPMFHVSGLTTLTTALIAGGTLVGMRRWDPVEAARLIVDNKVTALSGPPLVVQDLLALPGAGDFLSGLVQIGVGGQATPPNLTERMRELAPGAAQGGGWGMTETVGTVCSASGALADARPGSAGRLSPLIDVRAVDVTGGPLPAGEIGELQIRGVLVMPGYWDQPEATARAFDGDWYRTGDVGYVDSEGFVYVVDRLTDMVICGGENIYCAEVEHALAAGDHFAEVAVFGVPDPRLGERAVAAVTLRDGVALTAEDVQNAIRERLADYKVPAEVTFDLGPFPRTATGKVEKGKLRAAYLSRANGVG